VASIPAPPPGGPPAALVSGPAVAGGPAAGSLGSYTWGDQGSDAPWIVPPTATSATSGTPVAIAFDPAVAATWWVARWGPIVAGRPGDVETSAEGAGPVRLLTPDAAGPWSLQVEAHFGDRRGATWYWRVDVE
jgi:hypothetical protein